MYFLMLEEGENVLDKISKFDIQGEREREGQKRE